MREIQLGEATGSSSGQAAARIATEAGRAKYISFYRGGMSICGNQRRKSKVDSKGRCCSEAGTFVQTRSVLDEKLERTCKNLSK